MRAYEMRPEGVTARVFDSADSMKHRSLTEVGRKKGGRAHRRSRIPRFSVLSNTPKTWYWGQPGPGGASQGWMGQRAERCPSPGRADCPDYLISTFAPCSSRAALIFSASSLVTPSLTALGEASTRSLASLRPRPVSSRTTLMTGILLGPISVRVAVNSVCSSGAAATSADPPPAAGAAAAAAGAAAVTP